MAQEADRLMILELLEKGKITSEEAAKLLASLNTGDRMDTATTVDPSVENNDRPRQAHWMRIRVTEASTGKRKFNLLLPIFFMKFGISFTGRRVKTDEERVGLEAGREFFKNAVKGKFVDVSDPEDDERVEISFL